jgi:hypothetical protein
MLVAKQFALVRCGSVHLTQCPPNRVQASRLNWENFHMFRLGKAQRT